MKRIGTYLVLATLVVVAFILLKQNRDADPISKQRTLSGTEIVSADPSFGFEDIKQNIVSETIKREFKSIADEALFHLSRIEKDADADVGRLAQNIKNNPHLVESILSEWESSLHDPETRVKLAYFMGEVGDKAFIPVLKDISLSKPERDESKDSPNQHHGLDSLGKETMVRSFAVEAILKIDKEAGFSTIKGILSQCDRSSWCFNAVQSALDKGMPEEEILTNLPKDFTSIHF